MLGSRTARRCSSAQTALVPTAPTISVRPLRADRAEESAARDVWATAMRSYGSQPGMDWIINYVNSCADDPCDMGSVYKNYVNLSAGKQFWVACAAPAGDEAPAAGFPAAEKHGEFICGGAVVLKRTAKFSVWGIEHRMSPAADSPQVRAERIVGCVGAFLRSPSDVRAHTPPGCEPLPRHEGGDPLPFYDLEGDSYSFASRQGQPFASRSGDSPGGAAELVRMAVDGEFRGLGVAEKLVAAVAEFAVAQTSPQCPHVVLATGLKMTKAIKAYLRMGFEERAVGPGTMACAALAEDLLAKHGSA
jgi:GNAT superfamily N-acetyltransferase